MNLRLQRPLRVATIVFALAVAIVPAAQAQDEKFIPGYTDFPNALRVESNSGNAGERFLPGHTDFPNHLRVESVYDSARGNSGADTTVVVVPAAETRGFDWTDAGIGAGGAAGLLLLAAGIALLAIRRPIRGTALTG
jgi:hypothetical protein